MGSLSAGKPQHYSKATLLTPARTRGPSADEPLLVSSNIEKNPDSWRMGGGARRGAAFDRPLPHHPRASPHLPRRHERREDGAREGEVAAEVKAVPRRDDHDLPAVPHAERRRREAEERVGGDGGEGEERAEQERLGRDAVAAAEREVREVAADAEERREEEEGEDAERLGHAAPADLQQAAGGVGRG